MSSNEAIDRLASAIGHAVGELQKLNRLLERKQHKDTFVRNKLLQESDFFKAFKESNGPATPTSIASVPPKRRGRPRKLVEPVVSVAPETPPKPDAQISAATENAVSPSAQKVSVKSGDRLVRYDELRPKFGIRYSRVHLSRLEKIGAFPKRLVFGHSTVGWLASDIVEYLRSAARAR